MIVKHKYLLLLPLFILLLSIVVLYQDSYQINIEKNQNLATYEDENIFIKNLGQIEPFCSGFKNKSFIEQDYKYLKSIDIQIVDINSWYENLLSLFVNNTDVISEEYKKRFDAKIILNLSDSNKCNLDARVRINGDWKDHIKLVDGNPISSLDVHLLNGNIFGVTKFKLFMPETRNGSNEIFTSTLFSELGFLSPRTFFVETNLNEKITTNYIFQEKFTKEFVEFNNYREGPLIQTNDKTQWTNTSGKIKQPENLKPLYFGYITNKSWFFRNKENFLIGNDALLKYNRLISLYQGKSIYYPEVEIRNQIFSFDAVLYATISNHMYNKINRKFFYDSLNKELIPAYYDGNSEILFENNTFDVTIDKISHPVIAYGAREVLDRKEIDIEGFQEELSNRGLDLTIEDVSKFIEKFYSNLKLISNLSQTPISEGLNNIESSKSFISFREYFQSTFSIYSELLTFDKDSNYILKCDNNLDSCENLISVPIDYKQISKIENLPFIPTSNAISIEYNTYKITNDIYLKTFENPEFKIDTKLKKIDIQLQQKNQKVIIYSDDKSQFKDWVINAEGSYDSNISKNNELGLTGCVTFYNISFVDIIFESNNLFCEDSLNVINSEGTFLDINIQNSFSDALDIDFSTVTIDKLNIENAQNDCLDLSYGDYQIIFSNLSFCGDKGISIGEMSVVEVNDVIVKNSSIGVVVKDSSNVLIKRIETRNTPVCFAFYRKKMEFIHPIVKITNLICENETSYVQEGVKFEN